MTDTYNMNTDKNIVDDLQVRCVTYTLLRKWPTRGESNLAGVLAYSMRAAELLGMQEWQGFEAYRAWLESSTEEIHGH
jgi:hypothetical protein